MEKPFTTMFIIAMTNTHMPIACLNKKWKEIKRERKIYPQQWGQGYPQSMNSTIETVVLCLHTLAMFNWKHTLKSGMVCVNQKAARDWSSYQSAIQKIIDVSWILKWYQQHLESKNFSYLLISRLHATTEHLTAYFTTTANTHAWRTAASSTPIFGWVCWAQTAGTSMQVQNICQTHYTDKTPWKTGAWQCGCRYRWSKRWCYSR